MMNADESALVAGSINPTTIMEQIGNWGSVGIIIAFVVLLIVVKVIFSVLKKAVAIAVTLAMTGALGGGIIGLLNGWFDKIPNVFNAIFDNMPWS